MLRVLTALVFVGLLGAVCAPEAAFAQTGDEGMQSSARARAEFEAGRAAFDDERFEDALRYFESAYELSGRPGLLFNIGLSADELGRSQTAIEAYELFVATDTASPERARAQARLDELGQERSAAVAIAAPASTADSAESDGAVFEQWWFWAIVGAVIAGGAITTILLVGDEGPTGEGGVIFTLRP